MSISNDFTRTYQLRKNGQSERYKGKVLEMLRCYVNYYQREWEEYVQVLTYAYNTAVHFSPGPTSCELVLSRTPSDTAIYHGVEEPREKEWKDKEEWVMTVARVKLELEKMK